MKLANISLSALALVFAASAFSADLTVQGELIGSQGKLDAGKTTLVDKASGESITLENEGKADSIGAAGAGLSLQYKLNDALRLGGGLSWANYDGGKDKGEYSDFSVGANATYDFFKQDALALYGLGGLSYHMVDPKDASAEGLTQKYKSADLLNYDLGVGGRYELAQNVNLSLSYRFSDTLAKGTLESTVAAAGVDVGKSKTKDVSLQKNDFVAAVGYSF